MSKVIPRLPLEIASVSTANLLSTLELVRGCLKTTSMLWMHALSLPVLSGVVVSDWSKESANAVRRFVRSGRFSKLLVRIDKRDERWTRRRGGYLLSLAELPTVINQLRLEGMIAALLEPASPYADQYSLTGVTVPDEEKVIVEVVGPGFDASDILRGDTPPHERWEIGLRLSTQRRIKITSQAEYADSVRKRLAKIGARLKDPAFPDDVRGNTESLANAAITFLKASNQTTMLKHAKAYVPIPEKHVALFGRYIQKLLSGLSAYGIHLGLSSFAASVIPKRGMIFWDFFPARKQEAGLLYPS